MNKRRTTNDLGTIKTSFNILLFNCLNDFDLNKRGLEEDVALSFFPRCRGLTADEQQEKYLSKKHILYNSKHINNPLLKTKTLWRKFHSHSSYSHICAILPRGIIAFLHFPSLLMRSMVLRRLLLLCIVYCPPLRYFNRLFLIHYTTGTFGLILFTPKKNFRFISNIIHKKTLTQ